MNAMSEIRSSLSDRIRLARDMAVDGGIPVRRKDAALYALLAECLSICEHVEAEGLQDELAATVRVSVDLRGHNNAGRGRRYTFKVADTYVVVARAVLEGVDGRNSVYRYAATLREAARRGIGSADLAEWLKKNGGANALYKTRPVEARSVKTKTLHLTAAVEAPKGRPFTITLMARGDGFFDVVKEHPP